jgi:hypothetical protein
LRAEDRTKDTSQARSVEFSRYSFLELNNIQALHKEDVAYMRSKGCFSVPDQPVLDEFINQFFLHVHPETPVLDEARFWRLYSQASNGVPSWEHKISLFVFHAMLFNAVPVSVSDFPPLLSLTCLVCLSLEHQSMRF